MTIAVLYSVLLYMMYFHIRQNMYVRGTELAGTSKGWMDVIVDFSDRQECHETMALSRILTFCPYLVLGPYPLLSVCILHARVMMVYLY